MLRRENAIPILLCIDRAGTRPSDRAAVRGHRITLGTNHQKSKDKRQAMGADISCKERPHPGPGSQTLREAARNWARLTSEQQNHIKNDLLPIWKQMSPARRNAIKSSVGVLRNMPESARNRHLNDPNFTLGMSEEDKAMLRDLSHVQVGAPDTPNE